MYAFSWSVVHETLFTTICLCHLRMFVELVDRCHDRTRHHRSRCVAHYSRLRDIVHWRSASGSALVHGWEGRLGLALQTNGKKFRSDSIELLARMFLIFLLAK